MHALNGQLSILCRQACLQSCKVQLGGREEGSLAVDADGQTEIEPRRKRELEKVEPTAVTSNKAHHAQANNIGAALRYISE